MCEETNHKRKDDVQERNPGVINWVGTMHSRNLTFYKMNGEYFVRSKSSLTRKRVKRDACFKKTRVFAAKLGRASSIASSVYKQLPEGWRLHSLYRKLTGVGFQLLKIATHTDDEVIRHLRQYLRELGYSEEIHYDEVPPSTATYQEPIEKRRSTFSRKQKQHTVLKIKYWQALGLKLPIKDFLTVCNYQYLSPDHCLRWIPAELSG